MKSRLLNRWTLLVGMLAVSITSLVEAADLDASSYALGYRAGSEVFNGKEKVDQRLSSDGIRDGYLNRQLAYLKDELQRVFVALGERHKLVPVPPVPAADFDKLSYVLGYDFGARTRRDGQALELDAAIAGFNDGAAGKPAVASGQVMSRALQESDAQRQEKYRQEHISRTRSASNSSLPANSASAADFTFCVIQTKDLRALFSEVGVYSPSVGRQFERQKGFGSSDSPQRQHVTLCYPYKSKEIAIRERAASIDAHATQGGFKISLDSWSPGSQPSSVVGASPGSSAGAAVGAALGNKLAGKSPSETPTESAQEAPPSCLSASREGHHMAIRNKCRQRIEVVFCYKKDSNEFLCSRGQFGQVSVSPGQTSGVSLPSADGPGQITMVGCFNPAIPGQVKFDGSTIRAQCW